MGSSCRGLSKCIAVVLVCVGCLYAQGSTDPIPEGFEWPCQNGIDGGNTGRVGPVPLVNSMVKVITLKPVWEGEESLYMARCCSASDAAGCKNISGGFSSLISYDGTILLFHYRPSGDVIDPGLKSSSGSEIRARISADDEIICIDAATGKNKWKAVFADKGYSWNAGGKTGPQNTPCAWNGRVYAVGTTGRIYCVDAETGEPIWEGHIGKRHHMMERLKEISLQRKKLYAFNRDMLSCPKVIGGVVVCNTHTMAKGDFPEYTDSPAGLIAWDALTGDSLWQLDGVAGYISTPAKWEHGGKEYIVIGNDSYWTESPGVHCLEPRTGEEVWKIVPGSSQRSVYVWKDYLLCQAGSESTTRKAACYKLNLTEPTRLWVKDGINLNSPPVMTDGRAYIRGNGKLYEVDLETGTEIANQTLGEGGFLVSCGNLLVGSFDESHGGGHLFVVDRRPEGIKTIAPIFGIDAAGGYEVWVTPVFLDGRMWVRMQDRVACYDYRDGTSNTSSPRPAEGPVTGGTGRVRGPGDARVRFLDPRGRVCRPGPRSGAARLSPGVWFVEERTACTGHCWRSIVVAP